MEEVNYRTVEGYPAYRVGDDGTVWTQWRKASKGKCVLSGVWRKLKPRISKVQPRKATKYGYRVVTLTQDGKPRSFQVSNLVLTTFVGPKPQECMEACHINGISTDDRAVNLKWATPKENADDKKRHGTYLCGSATGNSVLVESQVAHIKTMLLEGYMCSDLADEYGVSKQTIHRIAKGFTWKHVEPIEEEVDV